MDKERMDRLKKREIIQKIAPSKEHFAPVTRKEPSPVINIEQRQSENKLSR
jgi:hypothetical protein